MKVKERFPCFKYSCRVEEFEVIKLQN